MTVMPCDFAFRSRDHTLTCSRFEPVSPRRPTAAIRTGPRRCRPAVRSRRETPRLPTSSNSGSAASMQRKKRSWLARANCGTLNTRVMRPRQAVQEQHAQKRRERRHQNQHLERDRNEHGPTVVRAAADIERIVDGHRPVLHEETDAAANQPADQHHERDAASALPQLAAQALDGIGRVGVHLAIAGLPGHAAWPSRISLAASRTRPSGRKVGGRGFIVPPHAVASPAAGPAFRTSRSSAESGRTTKTRR